MAAEEVGADGAYFRVHHFARQLASPFPLLAAVGARTNRIEIGTAVIDMRYENPLYMAEDAGAADLISGGRLQLGISRGSPEQVIDGFRYFGHVPAEGSSDADMAREHTKAFLEVLSGEGFAAAEPAADVRQPAGPAARRAALAGSAGPDLVGRRHAGHRRVDRRAGPQPDELDAAHRGHRRALPPAAGRADPTVPRRLAAAGHDREPRVSVSRSIFPIVSELDRQLFWRETHSTDQVGWLDGGNARFGKTYAGEPDKLVAELAEDEAIAAADTLLLTVPNQLGVDYNAHILDSVVRHLAPELGWR